MAITGNITGNTVSTDKLINGWSDKIFRSVGIAGEGEFIECKVDLYWDLYQQRYIWDIVGKHC